VDYEKAAKATGWIGYAAIMLVFAGGWNVFEGILAVARSKVFVLNATYVFSDLRTWGWIVLVIGAGELLAGFAILNGSQFARWFGVAAAGINSVGQLMFLHAYPFWSIAMFAVDMLIIYALVVYGGREIDLE
jgi:hypothetical protein